MQACSAEEAEWQNPSDVNMGWGTHLAAFDVWLCVALQA